MNPTDEQTEIIDAFSDGSNMVIEAYAGTGKSTTLKMLGESNPERHGYYIAFNRAVADEAKWKFPPNVVCGTAHSFAFHAVAKPYADGRGINGSLVTPKQAAEHLGIRKWFKNPSKGRKDLSSWRIASLAVQTVRKFCYSADEHVLPKHVPFVEGVENMGELRHLVAPYAVEIWRDLQDPNEGFFRFEHDHYLKLWAMSNPRLSGDFIMVDESQDTNPVLAQIVMGQDHMQRVFVGDSRQQLFAWRGAVDVMKDFDADARLFLTQSFRFGDEIAEEANRWISYMDDTLPPLRGTSSIDSKRVDRLTNPRAILCRTNADVIDQAMYAQNLGVSVAIVGGTNEIVKLARAVEDLKRPAPDNKTSHPDLAAFQSWSDVLSYVEEEKPEGTFPTFVRMLNRYGTQKVLDIANHCIDEASAERVVSTVHKVKGLEWDSVRVDGGVIGDEPGEQDMMIAYVACTRAKLELDASAFNGFHDRQSRRPKPCINAEAITAAAKHAAEAGGQVNAAPSPGKDAGSRLESGVSPGRE